MTVLFGAHLALAFGMGVGLFIQQQGYLIYILAAERTPAE